MSAACGLALLLTLLASPAAAQRGETDECDRWFPNITCGTDLRFPGFSPPLGAPYLFEDPFITTGVQTHLVWNEFPERSVFQGGDVTVAAAQVRLAITDRLALIATKDGWARLRPDQPLLNDETGFMDLGLGIKYALVRSAEQQFILTPSLRYETTQGSHDVFSGNGEGTWILGTSLGWGVGSVHLLGNVAAQLPVDGDAESSVLSYNLQVDFPLPGGWTPVLGLNGLHYLDDGAGTNMVKLASGARLPLATVQNVVGSGRFEGNDVLNLGSNGVEGNDVISVVFGIQRQVNDRWRIGLNYEHPLTRRKDLLQHRIHFSLLYELH